VRWTPGLSSDSFPNDPFLEPDEADTMKVLTYLNPTEVDPARVVGATAVVIDVIRATSTIVEALAAGARAVYPTKSTDDAIRLATSLGREDTLLCGERKGLKIEGFELGNSPGEYTPETVADKRLVMSTTNGTRAFLAVEDAERVVCASLLNLSATAASIRDAKTLVLVCAGKEDRFSLDDALCAGLILLTLGSAEGSGEGEPTTELVLDDASRAVLALTESFTPDVELLRLTAAGSALVDVGLGADLEHCAMVDRHGIVPEMEDRIIHVPSGA
jgi:2-phosphosulfolactate phosphatase